MTDRTLTFYQQLFADLDNAETTESMIKLGIKAIIDMAESTDALLQVVRDGVTTYPQ